jgi:hypothetical protein
MFRDQSTFWGWMGMPGSILRSFVVRVLAVVVLAAAAFFVAPSVVASAQPPVAPLAPCGYASMDSPHYSSGAGGAIAKFRWCNESTYQVAGDLYLFLCPTKPSSDESTWGDIGCVLKKHTTMNFTAVGGSTYTRYVPPTGYEGAHGTGWWVACAVLTSPWSAMIPSVPQYFSA